MFTDRRRPVSKAWVSIADEEGQVEFDGEEDGCGATNGRSTPRPPADLRLKVLKKFHGKFLPKGVLRERYNALMTRWNSGEDHGGVTLEELKGLLADWRATREKPPRMPKATA